MRIISLNVGLFEANNNKLKQFLKPQKADIICLQEVTRRVDKKAFSKYISKDAVDKATSDLSSAFFAPNWIQNGFEVANFHGKELFKFDLGGFVEFGNYVKSKFKIIKAQNIFLQNHFSLITDWSKWPEEDYKSFQVVDMVIGENKLQVINYHGIWSKGKLDSEKTYKACQKINELASAVKYPVIICGDFNLFPNTKSMLIFKDKFISLVDKFDIKSTRPYSNELSNLERNIVDYIFVSKDIRVESFAVLNSDLSDHLPLILDFTL